MANHQHLTINNQHPISVITLCDICMPKAFCGFETVRKEVLLNLWVLWEKNLYEVCKQAQRGNLTYYSPLHSERGWGWGLCVLCMPKAFCGLEMCAKRLSELCALCERKKYPQWEKEILTVRERTPQTSLQCFFSHRVTQKYRENSPLCTFVKSVYLCCSVRKRR